MREVTLNVNYRVVPNMFVLYAVSLLICLSILYPLCPIEMHDILTDPYL